MRKLQNIVSNFGNIIARQGNQLVVRIETLRSLRAGSSLAALRSYASTSVYWLDGGSWPNGDAWQSASPITRTRREGTASGFASAIIACVKQVAVVKLAQRRHLIMCHRAAA